MRRHRIVYSEMARADIIAIGDESREVAGKLMANPRVSMAISLSPLALR